jgi:hypothetical protein
MSSCWQNVFLLVNRLRLCDRKLLTKAFAATRNGKMDVSKYLTQHNAWLQHLHCTEHWRPAEVIKLLVSVPISRIWHVYLSEFESALSEIFPLSVVPISKAEPCTCKGFFRCATARSASHVPPQCSSYGGSDGKLFIRKRVFVNSHHCDKELIDFSRVDRLQGCSWYL